MKMGMRERERIERERRRENIAKTAKNGERETMEQRIPMNICLKQFVTWKI